MTTSGAESGHEAPRAPSSRGLAGPPGRRFYLATLGAILIALDANSRGSFGLFLLAAAVWVPLAGIWLVRFVVALIEGVRRMSAATWARWLAIPLALGLVFGITRTDVVWRMRFDLSRSALDRMAEEVTAGGSLDRGWAGLYLVGTAERTANGFWFILDDSGLSRRGLAYSPDGEPRLSEDNYSPLWTGPWFDHLDGPWWVFAQAWD